MTSLELDIRITPQSALTSNFKAFSVSLFFRREACA